MSRLSPIQAEMMNWPVLKPIDPPPGMGAVALNKPVCVVGARNRVHLPLPSPLVSNAHALIVNASDGVYLRDLVSTNHVYLNDEPVREAVLHDGDTIRIGPFAFRCTSGFSKDDDASGGAHAAEARVRLDGGELDLPLNGHAMVVGSRQGCDIQLDGIGIAPAHAVIFERDGKHFVRDLGVKTRTYHNDERVYHEAALAPGDRIRVGDKTLRYEEGPPPAPAATATAEDEDLVPLAWDETELPAAEESAPVPLSPDDSAVSPAPHPAAAEAAAPAVDLNDSGPIPLLVEDDEPAAANLPVAESAPESQATAPEPATADPVEARVQLSDEPLTEPAEEESELNVAALAEPFPAEHDLQPVEDRAERLDESAVAPGAPDEPATPHEPGLQVDRPAAERQFTRMLDDLEEQIVEVKETWKELRPTADEGAELPGHRAEEPTDPSDSHDQSHRRRPKVPHHPGE